MAQDLKSIQKLGLNAPPPPAGNAPNVPAGTIIAAPPVAAGPAVATLELAVTKTGGPVATFVEVGSSGDDDEVFDDRQLDPGPARKALLQGNFYAIVWRGAFVAPGTATLHVRATSNSGAVIVQKDVTVSHPPTSSPFTIVVL